MIFDKSLPFNDVDLVECFKNLEENKENDNENENGDESRNNQIVNEVMGKGVMEFNVEDLTKEFL